MNEVPFYPNHDDAMHCALAVYKSVLDYFLNRKFSWDELEKISDYKRGKAAWTVKALTHIAGLGLDIRMVEPFDYKRYLKEGDPYLHEIYGGSELQWLYDHSNVREIRPLIAPFLLRVTPECRIATLADIDALLEEERLVFVTVNARALNGKEGFVSHALLVLGKDGEDYVAHDPGPEPQANRHIHADILEKAMGATAEVTGFKPSTSHGKKRLDVYVTEQLPSLSRAFAQKLCEQGRVLVNGKQVKAGYRLHASDVIAIDYDIAELADIPKIDLPVLYEDDDCVVINKPAGVLTHSQGSFKLEGTVASFLRDKVATTLSGARAGIVHRLDRATSGVIIGAKHQEALSWLQKQFADRKVQKTYVAIVQGHLNQPEAIVDMPIQRNPKAPATFRVHGNGKAATTHYKVLQETDDVSLVELKPQTGRTHQLRVHLAHIGHPIVGDPLYGGAKYGDRLYLHALSLEITLPSREHQLFTAPLPPEFEERMHGTL